MVMINDVIETHSLPALPSDSACSLCGADTQSPDFRSHEHGENLCGRGTISCSLCSKTFALWSHYEAHKKGHQKLKQRQYPCQSCGKVSKPLLILFSTHSYRSHINLKLSEGLIKALRVCSLALALNF